MALADILRARAAFQGRTATVECGELGELTVESLPLRELQLLYRGPDGARSVFFAACRELQLAGETLRREKKIYTPDGILQFVSDEEAEAAARTVFALSGMESLPQTETETGGEPVQAAPENVGTQPEPDNAHEASAAAAELVRTDEEPDGTTEELSASGKEADRTSTENRLASVQKPEKDFSEIRPDVVQLRERNLTAAESGGASVPEENRLTSVQDIRDTVPGNGQVSRELEAAQEENGQTSESDKKPQGIGHSSFVRTQNVVSGQPVEDKNGVREGALPEPVHESKSEVSAGLHETESEIFGVTAEKPHETMSDFVEQPHETKSESGGKSAEPLHEMESDSPAAATESLHEIRSETRKALHETESDFRQGSGRSLHEVTSEFRKGLHETTSESTKHDSGRLHENKSELAETVARQLLEGLRRASWVRGR